MAVSKIYVPEVFPVAPPDYTFTFESIGANAIEVYELDVDGNRTFIPPSGYDLALAGGTSLDNVLGNFYNGGTVSFTQAHGPSTIQVQIERNTPITQNIDFKAYDRFAANVLEWALDKITMIMQEIEARKCSCPGGDLDP